MEVNKENQNLSHFPEDLNSPHITEKRSFLSEIYFKNKKVFDYLILLLISLITFSTVSLSIYILISKIF